LEFLELWDSLKITGAIRKWHLAAHIPECFTKFTLNFIKGASQVKGEILETLWSGMDEVAGLAQAMSTAYHQEILDEYINDSNWQKIIWMGRSLSSMYYYISLTLSQADSLCRKWSQAKEGLSDMKPAFDQLSECLDQSLLDEWMAQECTAMDLCGNYLKIYKVTSDKCRQYPLFTLRHGRLKCVSTNAGRHSAKAVRSQGLAW
jgi:Kyakuja-Dileera-Zisupton transposase